MKKIAKFEFSIYGRQYAHYNVSAINIVTSRLRSCDIK